MPPVPPAFLLMQCWNFSIILWATKLGTSGCYLWRCSGCLRFWVSAAKHLWQLWLTGMVFWTGRDPHGTDSPGGSLPFPCYGTHARFIDMLVLLGKHELCPHGFFHRFMKWRSLHLFYLGSPPQVILFNMCIAVCESCRRWEMALQLWHELQLRSCLEKMGMWCAMMCHDVAHAVMVRLLGQACKLMSWPTVGSLALAVLANNGRQQPPQILFGWCAWIRNVGIQVGWPDRQLFLLQGFIKSSSFWWLDWTAMKSKSLPRQWSWWVAFWAIPLFSPMLCFTMQQSVHVLILGCWFSMLQLGSHCQMNNFVE